MIYEMTDKQRQWIEGIFEKIKQKLSSECARVGSKIPYIPRDGRYLDLDVPSEGICWWTNGFWAGIMWQMYNATGDEQYRLVAQRVEERLDECFSIYENLHHDVGFMWLHTSVANYRLTGNKESRKRGLLAANLLAGRYNPEGRFIRAWNGDCTGWMIVDCMMNIPILYWASRELDDPRFSQIAANHADTCLRVSLRQDGSCNHISIMDPATGECLDNPGGQGYASGSSWSRGQAWAIYGFALSYLHSGKQAYLDAAKQVAHYFIANAAQNRWLPLVDFRAPKDPVKYDSTAAMCAICAMLEIAKHVGENEQRLYVDSSLAILEACEKAFCNWNPDEDAIVGGGSGSYHGEGFDANAPIIYGDYFLVEAVLRLLGKDFHIW